MTWKSYAIWALLKLMKPHELNNKRSKSFHWQRLVLIIILVVWYFIISMSCLLLSLRWEHERDLALLLSLLLIMGRVPIYWTLLSIQQTRWRCPSATPSDVPVILWDDGSSHCHFTDKKMGCQGQPTLHSHPTPRSGQDPVSDLPDATGNVSKLIRALKRHESLSKWLQAKQF